MDKILSFAIIPILLLNAFGAIVAGIWLGFLGEWKLIAYGIGAMLLGNIFIGILLMPGIIFVGPSSFLINRGYKLSGHILGFLGFAYTQVILALWCISVLLLFLENTDYDSLIPILLWSYAAATGPISYMAQKEINSGNDFSGISSLFLQIAFLLTILGIVFIGMSPPQILGLFAIVVLASSILQFFIALSVGRGVSIPLK